MGLKKHVPTEEQEKELHQKSHDSEIMSAKGDGIEVFRGERKKSQLEFCTLEIIL